MTQDQLEFAWLASIYTKPEYCRTFGLHGLDHSMFKNQSFFELGQKILRAEDFDRGGMVPPRWVAEELMKNKLVARLEIAFDSMFFMPAFYEKYCKELERRVDKAHDAEWIG